jgi:hypothetical protein
MRFCLLSSFQDATRRRLAMTILVGAFLAACVTPSASGQLRNRGKKQDKPPAEQTPPAEEVVSPAMTMSKTQAIFGLIQALTLNQSDKARETLEQIVVGKIKFGGHSQQAAESALAALAFRPSPDAVAFVLHLVSESDEKVRPGDTDYPAAAVRYDAVRLAGRVGSVELRVGLAKLYDRATPEIRTAIEAALGKPSPANFTAQVILLRSRATSDDFKMTLRKLILEQNAAAIKQALKIAGTAPAKETPPAGAAGLLGQLGGLAGMSAPAPAAPAGAAAGRPSLGNYPGSSPAGAPSAAATTVHNPTALVLEVVEKAINSQPMDPAVVARELWQSEFVEALSAQLSTEKRSSEQVLSGVGSIPLKSARERLRDYLQKKSPQDLGQLEKPTPPVQGAGGAPGSTGIGTRGMGGGVGGMSRGAPGKAMGSSPAQPAYLVGSDWLDPGTLIVLKSLGYKDRPKGKHRATTPPPSTGKRSAAAEKRAEEAADRAKQAEAQYEWRDTMEKFLSHWDERLSAVAETHEAAGTDSDAAGTKEKAGAKDKKDQTADKTDQSKAGSTKSTKDPDSGSKKTPRTPESKSASDSKTKGPAPTTAVPVPFTLRSGEQITKEFHLRWPEDLPSNLTASVSEPLIVHYIELEATDDINRTATYYRGALAKGTGTKVLSTTHDIAEGKWVDILQHDLNGQRTRSLDVLITRKPADADAKRSRLEELTIQVLMVEVESFVPEAKPAEKKEQAKSDSP